MIDVSVDYRPDRPLHPGRFLKEQLNDRGLTQHDFAHRMQRPPQVINQIVREKKSITAETALGIEKVLGIEAKFWVNLQAIYDLAVARQAEDEKLLEREQQWLARFPLKEMIRLGWLDLEPGERDSRQLRELLKFFAVQSFGALQPSTEAIGFRVTDNAKIDEWALRAWLRQGEREAEKQTVAVFDHGRFQEALHQIRMLTTGSPALSWPQMQQLCAEAGVALVAVSHLPKTGANGVARWLSRDKALIQLNLRYRWADIFWFTFFHEARHVLQHQTRRIFVDLPRRDRTSPEEVETNRLASDLLIPPARYEQFVQDGSFSAEAVTEFADEIEIHAGIVVGQLQHDQKLPHSHLNDLRERWQFTAVG